MQYVVIYQIEGRRLVKMDQWYDKRIEAEKRCEELQGMFDWMYERSNTMEGPCKCWIEEKV